MARIAVVGATGTLGQALLTLLSELKHDVIGLSRDELKQAQLAPQFPQVSWALADIRDVSSLYPHFRACDAVFHVAALKHVDILENNPMEAIKTNLLGTVNVVEACALAEVPTLAFCSTDKAVKPINTYGFTKGISERYLLYCHEMGVLGASIFRWGNVVGSRGSFIDNVAKKLNAGEEIPITDMAMTRFWVDIDDAANFMIKNYDKTGEVHIPPMKASKVIDMVVAIADVLQKPIKGFNIVGLRPGEKIHEAINATAFEELTSQTCEQYTASELRGLVSKHFARIAW